MNRKRRGGFSILAAVLAVMLALFLGLLFWLLHGNEEPERILQGAAGTETLSVSGQASPPENSGQDVPGDGSEQPERTEENSPVVIIGAEEAGENDGSGSSDGEGELEDSLEEAVPEEEINLLFAGDVFLSSHVLNAYDTAGGIGGVLDEELRQVIQASDYFMVNQEFPFSDRGTAAEDKQFTFRLPPSRVHLLQEMGIDMVTLANNHSLDFGTDALLDTCRTLDEAGIRYVGAGENMARARQLETVEVKGKTIGFLGSSRVIPVYDWTAGEEKPGVAITYDPGMLLKDIAAAKQVCDYVVVYVHWGKEKAVTPEEYQQTMGRQYIDAGADLVIGSHPHVLQGIEYYQGKPIVYSLGNFVFGSSIPRTMLLQAALGKDGVKLSAVPCKSAAGYTQMEKDPEKITAFYQELQGLSVHAQVNEAGEITAAE